MRFSYFLTVNVANMLATPVKCSILWLIAAKIRRIFAIFYLAHARWTYVIAYIGVHHSKVESLTFTIVILVSGNLYKTFFDHYAITAIFTIEFTVRFNIFENLTHFFQLNLSYFVGVTYFFPICVLNIWETLFYYI